MVFGQLLLLVAAGLVGPLLAAGRRAVVPVVVGELAAGVVLGRTGFGILEPRTPGLPVFYALGFAMLMLSAGTHVDIGSPDFRRGAGRGALAFAAVAALVLPFALVISSLLHVNQLLLLVVLLAGSSAAVSFPIIEELHARGPAVATLFAWVAVADSVTVVLLPLTLTGTGQLARVLAGDVAIVAGAAVVYFLVARLISTGHLVSAWERSRSRGWALQLRLSILLLLALGTIAEGTGGSTLVAGFVSGIVLVRLREPERLVLQLTGLANGFFVPIFFVLLGATLDLRAMFHAPEAMALALAMAAGAVLTHVAAAMVTVESRKLAVGLAASAQLGLPAAAASLGLSSHILSPGLAAALVAGGVLTLVPATWGAVMLSRTGGGSGA